MTEFDPVYAQKVKVFRDALLAAVNGARSAGISEAGMACELMVVGLGIVARAVVPNDRVASMELTADVATQRVLKLFGSKENLQ